MRSYLFVGGPFHGKYIQTDGQKKCVKVVYPNDDDRKAGRSYPSTFTYYRVDIGVVTGERKQPLDYRPTSIRYVYSITEDDRAAKDLLYDILARKFVLENPDKGCE